MTSIKTEQEIQLMREAGHLLASAMRELLLQVREGVATEELNRAAEALILHSGSELAFKGYHGFPAALCVSVNDEVVHGVPSARKLVQGDIVSLDLGLIWKGFYADMARTVPVGETDPEALRLIRVTKKALRLGIKKVRAGQTTGDIGNTIQRHVESQGFQVVRELCGHGIGRQLHEDPIILNHGRRKSGDKLKAGMVICVEPMVTMGNWRVALKPDGQTYATKDGSLSAHFEDTMLVTEVGCEVFTRLEA